MTIRASATRFDLSDVRRRLGKNDALIADMLRMFVELHPQQMAAVESAVGSGRAEAVRTSAHSLKGFAGNLSATGVVEASGALERAAEQGHTGEFDVLFERVRNEMALLVDELTSQPEEE